jgi:hypothetical protein
MTTTEIDLSHPTAAATPTPVAQTAAFISQATAVEQARAVAEVQAAIVVAQQVPRSMQHAIEEMRDSCRHEALAERSFFRYSRAGSAITGPTVHLARELARCFGNVQYGITELRRDDVKGESEMQAFAWDVERNTRNSNTFVVPHARDTKNGRKPIVDLRDVYENNANMGARRLREAIFAILPTWFTEEAKDICSATLRDGGGKPLAQRRADAVKVYEGIGVTVDQLEAKQGRASDKWTEHDVAALGVTYKSIQRGEITVDEEFPQQRVTVDEISAAKPAPQTRSGQQAEPDSGPTAEDLAALNAEATADAKEAEKSR